jgi:hypothetical protein
LAVFAVRPEFALVFALRDLDQSVQGVRAAVRSARALTLLAVRNLVRLRRQRASHLVKRRKARTTAQGALSRVRQAVARDLKRVQ